MTSLWCVKRPNSMIEGKQPGMKPPWVNGLWVKLLVMVTICSYVRKTIDLPHDKTNKMACAPSEDSVQPGHQSLHCALNR